MKRDLDKKNRRMKITIGILGAAVVVAVSAILITSNMIRYQNENDGDKSISNTLSALWPNMLQHKIENNDEDTTVENYIPYEMSEYIFPEMNYETKVSTLYPQDEIQLFLDNEVSHTDSATPYIGTRTLTDEVVPYDGQERDITCWGDSMTEGNGTNSAVINVDGEEEDISFSTFPSVLQDLTGITTYNLGVGGETSIQIAQREGGIPMVTDRNLNVPTNGGVNFTLISPEYDLPVDINDYSGYGMTNERETNRVYINGERYKITFNGDSHMIFKKLSHKNRVNNNNITDTMTSTYIEAGTRVYTAASIDRQNDILIIEMGSNGGWDSYQELIQQYDDMIAFANCSYYIILGDTDDPDYAAGLGDTPWEAALREAYGDHFINMRTYLINNGLADCGLDTTYADIECYYNGQISKKLRSDWTHLNAYGYYAKGLAVYEKGLELGYWD